jgi:hypothetical protein
MRDDKENNNGTHVGHPSAIGSTGRLKINDTGSFCKVRNKSLQFFSWIGVPGPLRVLDGAALSFPFAVTGCEGVGVNEDAR